MTTHRRTLSCAAALTAALLITGCNSTADKSGGTSGGSTSGGLTSGATAAPPGDAGTSVPAAEAGACVIGPHTIANLGGLVTGTLNWECHGSVLMTLRVRLIYVGNNAEHEEEVDEGMPLSVDNITSTSPVRLTAPCTAGLWRLKVIGTITGVGSAPITVNSTDPGNAMFNAPAWHNPTRVTC